MKRQCNILLTTTTAVSLAVVILSLFSAADASSRTIIEGSNTSARRGENGRNDRDKDVTRESTGLEHLPSYKRRIEQQLDYIDALDDDKIKKFMNDLRGTQAEEDDDEEERQKQAKFRKRQERLRRGHKKGGKGSKKSSKSNVSKKSSKSNPLKKSKSEVTKRSSKNSKGDQKESKSTRVESSTSTGASFSVDSAGAFYSPGPDPVYKCMNEVGIALHLREQCETYDDCDPRADECITHSNKNGFCVFQYECISIP
mmetsp:Transcript_24071/g.35887  ORF Transcript_24071/g.35887 Transcript_24071/m.35887 type:complete len:256 (-) Transcript_24071:140-907(-)